MNTKPFIGKKARRSVACRFLDAEGVKPVDEKDTSVFDFNEKDPRPSSRKIEMFTKAFKCRQAKGCSRISAMSRRSPRISKTIKKNQQGRKFVRKTRYHKKVIALEDLNCECAPPSVPIEAEDSDLGSDGEVSRQPYLKTEGVSESSSSDACTGKEPLADKVTEVNVTAELLLSDDTALVQLIFTADAITLNIQHSSIIKWPLCEITRFGTRTLQDEGYALLKLGFTESGARVFQEKLKGTAASDSDDGGLVAKISDADWTEQLRQITSLSDGYKSLWRSLKGKLNVKQVSECVEDFQTSLGQEIVDTDDCERDDLTNSREEDLVFREDLANSREEHGSNDQVEEERHEVMWIDIVYPKGDHDAVTLTKNDFQLLSPGEFISDNIVDFYIKYLQSTLSEHDKKRFYFFNSFFFRKLTEIEKSLLEGPEKYKSAFEGVKRWTAKVNIFEKDYLFIPIMQSAHWSLIVICHPGYISTGCEETSTDKVPAILHFDSLEGCHTGLEEPIRNYLMEAWIQKNGCVGDFKSLSWKIFSELKYISAQVPQQTNYCDCALFLLHYVEEFIKEVQAVDSTEFVTSEWFNPAEASIKRVDIQTLILELIDKELREQGVQSYDLQEYLALATNGASVLQELFALGDANGCCQHEDSVIRDLYRSQLHLPPNLQHSQFNYNLGCGMPPFPSCRQLLCDALKCSLDYTREENLNMSETVPGSPIGVNINPIADNICADGNIGSGHMYHPCYDQVLETVGVSSSFEAFRLGNNEMQEDALTARHVLFRSTVGDGINLSTIGSKEMCTGIEYGKENSDFAMEIAIQNAGSALVGERESPHFDTLEGSSRPLKQSMLTLSMGAIDDQFPAGTVCEEKDSLYNESNNDSAIEVDEFNALDRDLLASRGEHESPERMHVISPTIQAVSSFDSAQYISSDEENSTPEFQPELAAAVGTMFEAAKMRRQSRRKKAKEDIDASQIAGRRPLTRSATKRTLREKPTDQQGGKRNR